MTQATSVKNNNVKDWFCIAVMFLLFFGVPQLPPFGHVTEFGMKVLGVFLGLLWGWVFIDLIWPSVLGFFILSLTGWTTPLGAVMAGFSNVTVSMMIVACAFAYCLSKVGVSEAIAYWILSKKIFVGKSWLLCAVIIIVAQLVGMAGGSFAGIFLMWSIIKAIADINNVPKGSMVTSFLYTATLISGMNGSVMVPFMPTIFMYSGFLENVVGTVPLGIQFMVVGELQVLLAGLALLAVAKWIFKMDTTGFLLTEELRAEYAAKKITRIQKIGLVATLVFFLALMLPTALKGDFWSVIGGWGIVGWSILYIVLFNILKDDEGKPACTVMDCFSNGITWGPVLLFMVTIPLAAAMESEQVGILATVNTWCMSLFGDMSLFALYVVIAVVIGLLTQVLHNVIVGAIFIPVLAPIVVSLGGDPLTFFLIIYATLQNSYATPAASMQASLIFGKEDVPRKHSYAFGIAYFLVGTLVTIMLIPVCDILFAGLM